MELLLEIENAREVSSTVVPRIVLGETRVVIGRRPGLDWCLHDPTRLVSSVHCEIEPGPHGHSLTDHSRNGTRVDGELVLGTAGIGPGSRIEIGPYRIKVSEAERPRAEARLNHGEATHLAAIGRPEDLLLRADDAAGEEEEASGKSAAHPSAGKGPDGWEEDEASPDAAATVPNPAASRMPPPRSRMAARPGFELLALIEDAAGLPTDALAGRDGEAVLREIVGALVASRDGLAEASRASRQLLKRPGTVAEPPRSRNGLPADLVDGEAAARAKDDAAQLTDELEALGNAVPVALFRLLNRLSPTTVEDAVAGGTRADARRWRLYRERWEEMALGSENGMLDIFLDELRAAHAERLKGL